MVTSPHSHRNGATAYVAWVLVCLIWGTTYLAIRIALETIPPALVGGIRFTSAGVILATVLLLRGEQLPSRTAWPAIALMGLLLLGIGNGAVVWAEQWVPSGVAALVVATTPFWLNGIDAVVGGDRKATFYTWVGLIVGFVGVVVLVWPDLTRGGARGQLFLLGLAALQLASLGWSLGTIYARRQAEARSAIGSAALQMIAGGGIMLLLGTVRGEWAQLTVTVRSAAAEVYLTVAGSIVAYSAYVYILKHLPLPIVSLYSYINPVIAVILGWALMGEPGGWRVAIAAALVIGGVVITRWPSEREQP